MSDQLFNTRLYLEGFEADLTDGAGISITYVIKDIADIASAASNYTKTITLPGTARNNQLFDFFFDIKSTGPLEANYNALKPNIGYNYNPKKRIKAIIIKDNQVMMEGYAQLVSTILTNGLVSYNVQISSPLTAFAAILSGNNPLNQQAYRLEDLPDELTSGYTHVVSIPNIVNSWTATPATSYFYPLIDYGQDDTVNTTSFYLSDFRPCLYAKQYWDMIFQAAGFTHKSDFINSDYFKSLIVPYKEGNISLDTSSVQVGTTFSEAGMLQTSAPSGTTGTAIYIFNDAIANPESLYNDTNLTFTPIVSGNYSFSVSFLFYYIFSPSNLTANLSANTQEIYVNFETYTSGGTLVSTQIYTRPVLLNSYGQFHGIWDTRNPNPNTGDFVTLPPLSASNIIVPITVGQYVKVSIAAASTADAAHMYYTSFINPTFVSGSCQMGIINADIDNGQPLMTVGYASVLDGASMTYETFCLKNVTQLDYITSIVRLFNLYVEQDKDNASQLNFYTRDEFFSDQKVLDWSNKIDYSQPIQITPLPNLQNNTFLYTYRPDSDFWNKQYTSLYGSTYGQLLVAVNYDFATDQLDVLSDSVFSPTPVVQVQNTLQNSETTLEVLLASENIISVTGYNNYVRSAAPSPSGSGFAKARAGNQISYWGSLYTITSVFNQFSFQVDRNVTRTPGAVSGSTVFYATNDAFTYITNNSKIIPCIYQSSDNNVTRSPTGVNPRILCYSGLADCASGETWTIQSTPITNSESIFNYQYASTSNPSIPALSGFTHYPYVSSLNGYQSSDPSTTPTLDLLFAPPSAVFYSGIYPTNIPNQFSYYWQNALNEIIDNEAKLVSCNIKLTGVDVANLDLSEIIHISGTNYKINQIVDFAADRSTTTQVELIRLPYQQVNTIPGRDITTTTQSPVLLSITGGGGLTDSISGVTVDGIGVSYISGTNLPITGSQTGNFAAHSDSISNCTVDVLLSNAVIGEILAFTDTAGTIFNNVISTAGPQTIVFTDIVMFPAGSASLNVTPATTTTSTTTTTTTTEVPVNITFNICNNAPGSISVTGFVTTTHTVNTNVTVDFFVQDSTGASTTGSTIVAAGSTSVSWGASISTGSSISVIRITSLSPTSSGAETYLVGGSFGWTGTCGATTTTTTTHAPTTTTTTTHAPTTTTTLPPTTTTTTAAPTAIVFNDGRGATISSVTGIAGFTCGVVTFGNQVTGFHSGFTGSIVTNISVGPTFAGNLFLNVNGVTVQTITVAIGFSGSKTFTSATYSSTDAIQVVLSA